MKLVAAKCPNCGANIEVDSNSDSTKCEFCNSKIIVEDAIEKYKIELSGEIEIKNLPTLKNHIKLAERYYADGEYEEALDQYCKICELDSSNSDAIVRRGICKSLLIRYPNFNVNHITNGLKNACAILEKKEDKAKLLNPYIIQCNFAFKRIESNIDYYADANILTLTEMEGVITRLIICMEKKEYLYSLIKDDENIELEIARSIIDTANLINKKRRYRVGRTSNSKDGNIVVFTVNKNTLNRINTIKRKYQTRYDYIMNKRNPVQEVKKTENPKPNNKLQPVYIVAIIGGLFTLFIFSALLFAIFGSYGYEGEWISGDEIVEIDGTTATIKNGNVTYNGDYKTETIDDGYIITITDENDIKHTYKYKEVDSNTILFCELVNDKCFNYYEPKEKKDGYTYATKDLDE